jgi:hypothetical protein
MPFVGKYVRASGQVEIAGGNTSYHYWTEEELLGPIGSPPEFPEPIETVRARESSQP